MEKSFYTLDKENINIHNQLNSTALADEECHLAPKTPQRDDIKISPILHDEPRGAFQSHHQRKMAKFRKQGDSPLARPPGAKTSSQSQLEVSERSNCTESGYISNLQSDVAHDSSSSKENHSIKTPGRVLKRVFLRNPFETRLLDHIHTTTLSPNLMEILPSPKDKTWPIEHRSILCPANITEEEIRMSRSIVDPEFEERVHHQLEIYWESGVGFIPSPDCPRSVIIESPMTSCQSSEVSSVRRIQSPAARPVEARRRCVTMRNTKCQTDMTIPPNFNFDFTRILGETCIYKDEDSLDSPEEDFDISLNTSLPRKLFNDCYNADDMDTDKIDADIIRQDLGNHNSPTRTASFLALDISPIRGD